MPSPTHLAFRQVWPRWFVIVMGIIELLCVVVFFLTELGNVASNFWYTNVFAGGWCGCVVFVHAISLFVVGCCSPSPTVALIVFVITIVTLIACAALISFDAIFLALPSTCILTPSCASNAASTTMFSYYFRDAFFITFRKLSVFQNYTQDQAKFLFQIVQVSVGGLCFILCIAYLILYLVSRHRATKIAPYNPRQSYPAPRPSYAARKSDYYQRGYPPQPSAPEAIPNRQFRNPQGEIH